MGWKKEDPRYPNQPTSDGQGNYFDPQPDFTPARDGRGGGGGGGGGGRRHGEIAVAIILLIIFIVIMGNVR
jgi:hypothetical protein